MTTTLSPSPLTASKLNASSFTAIFRHHSAKMICSLAVVLLLVSSVFAQTTTFNYSGTIVNYTVPAGVTKLTITTKGAQGGNAGGLGASMQGDFSVTPGQVLKILVGGQGGTSSGNSGGGGGSFVTTSANTPLIIAGGGGGATCTVAGLPGVTSTNGTNGSSSSSSGYGGGGGINGGGGGGSAGRYGAASGGAGLLGNGGRGIASISFFSYATGGGVGGNGSNGGDGTATSGAYTGISNSFIAGGAPGYAYGGFGGGGGVYDYDYCNSAAGGGGYSGGGGSYLGGGGGGGSYNSGTDQVNTAGVRSGNGEVTITPVLAAAAINFDGNDDYLRTTNPFYQFTNSITVEAWINTTQSVWMGQSTPDVDNWSNGNVWLWHIKAPGQGMDWYVNDGGVARGISLNTLSAGWHHIATTANACGMFIYVDGVLAVSSSTGISTGILNVANSVIDIGKDPRYSNVVSTGTDRYTAFSADEVRIWSRSLSKQEINAHKSCELIAGQMTGLQEYYQFNQGFAGDDNTAITTVTDASGNARNASINNLARTGTTSNFISPGGVTTGSNCSAFSLAAITGNGPLSVGGTITLANATAGGTWSSSVPGVATVNASGVVTGISAGTTVISYTIDCGTAATVTVTVSTPATALKFDGTNDYVAVNNPFTALNKEITVEFWMYTPTADMPYGSVMGQGTNNVDDWNNTVWLMHPNINGTMSFYVNDGGNARSVQCNIIAGSWHHYAGVANATSTKIYVDGILVQSGPGISNTILNNATSVIHIGKDVRYNIGKPFDIPRYGDMKIDEVRIWNRALCVDEIMNNINAEINPAGQTGLQQYYRFNQGLAGANNAAVTTLNDLSGNNRNGTLNNFTLDGANSNWVTSGSTNTGIVNAFVPPTAPITGITSICTGAVSTLANANAGGVWTSSNTAVATVNANTGAVNGVSAGTATITYTTACGGVSTATVTINPIPVVTIAAVGGTSTCPGSFVTLNANAPAGSTYQWSKGGVAISGAVNASYNATASGSYTVVVVNNGCTSAVSNAVVVTVADVQPPAISCPANISVPATSLAGAVVNYVTPVGTDNCSGATTVRTSGPASGSVFPIGTTTVIHTVTDGAGLTTSCTFTVTVIGALPVIVCPANITVSNSPGQCNATVNFVATETTGAPASTITYSIAPGSVFPVGTTAVTATATNALGSSSCTFTVTVTATDSDADGIPDGCDEDADNDGIPNNLECNKSNFFWSNPPTVSGNTATGTINGIAYTYTSSSAVSTTSSMFAHNVFPSSYGVPNTTCIKNTDITTNTITFASPMTNPVLVFASIGGNFPVGITFGAPVQIVFSQAVVQNSPTEITGTEGYAIVRMMGTFSSISFNYLVAENWCNFVFGADFQTCGDTDNDGIPDYLDTDSDNDGCPDAVEGSMSFSMSQLINGRLTGGINSQGIPLLAGSGQTIGTSQNNVVNCFCQKGLDETAPTVITKNITVNLNASGNVTINASQVDNGSTDNCGIANIKVSNTSFTCSNLGANTVTLTVTDTDGNESSATATVTVVDAIVPTVTCPANQILNLDGSCNAVLPDYRSLLVVNDNCTASNALVITQSPAAGTIVNAKGALIVTFTVTDAANNSQTCNITVDKRDVTAPVIVCRAPITVNNTANTCGAVVTYTNPTATDNCSGAAFNFWNAGEPNNYQNANEDYVQLYNNATWNDLPDYVLNKSIVEFNSIITTIFANYTLIGNFGGHTYYVSTGTATWLNSRAAAQAIGGDLASINTLAESQYLAPYGGNTWVGGYQDKTVPGFSEPGNASQNYLGWKWVDGTSLGAGQIVITQTAGLPSGSVFPVGVTTNTFTATDEAGNTSTCSFTVTVRDAQPPVITCPANRTVNATSTAGAVVTYVAPTGTDNCPGATTVRTAGPASGSVFPIGTTTITHTVTDAAGLTSSCSFTVTVAGAQPVVVCPANITVSNDPGQCGAKVNFAATETTGIPASTITYSMAPGSVFPVGTTTVTATATNVLGTSTCSFTVTVTATDTDADGVPDACDLDADNDGIPNSLECNQSNFFWSNPPVLSGNTATGTINGIGYTYTSTSPVSTTTYMYGHNQFPVSYGVPNVNPTIQNLAITNNTITFASPMTNPVLVFASIGNAGLPVPITFGAPVEVVWSKDVTINSPTSITGREGYAIVRMMGTFSTISFNYQAAENWCNFAFGADFQNCGDTDNDGIPNYLDTDSDGDGCPDAIEGSMSFSMSQTSGGRLTGGVNSQGIPLLAGAGQTIGTSQNYVLNCFCQPGLDETAPTVITKDITVNLNAGGNVTITPSQVNNGSSDACGIASMTVSKTNFTCSDIGANTVTLTVTDNDGNVSAASAVVTVVDNMPPVISCPANISVIATSAAGAVVNYIAPVGTDNCAGATTVRTAGPASGSTFSLGTTTVTHTVTDGAGLTTSCSFTVTVTGVPPVIVCTPTITASSNPGQCGAVVNFAATETAAIPASTITYSIPSGSFFNVGETTVTATATNAIGSSTCTFTVRVNDTEVPTVITQNVTVYLDNNGQASITPAQVNNGSTDNCAIATMTVSPNTFTCANVSSLVNISSQTIVSDNTWAESTTTYSTGNYCISNVWNGLASPLPSLASYTVVPAINAYSIVPIAGTQGLYGQSGVRFFRKTFTLNNLTDIKATLQVAMDNGVQIFINGVAVALKGVMSNTFNGANPVKAVLNSTGANLNGGVGGQSFDNITNTSASSLFVVGTNEIVLALANCDGTDRGAISFKAVIETNNGGQRPVVLTVTDVNGNSATANALVTVVDAINPVLTCQDNIAVIATSASGAVVNYAALTATDNCSAVVTRTAGLASGATFPIGITTVTHTAKDPSGNTVSCSFTVTVSGLPPVITCPADITVTTTAGQCGTIVNFAATETTAIPASLISYTENGQPVSSGSFFTVGTHTITATATNAVGTANCSFTITVTDNENPVITAPANIAVSNDAGICGAVVTVGDPVRSDNCGVAGVSNNAPAVFPVGTTIVTWTVTDIHGNSSTAEQTVTVTDAEKPVVFSCSGSTHFVNPNTCTWIGGGGNFRIKDNCSGSVVLTEQYLDQFGNKFMPDLVFNLAQGSYSLGGGRAFPVGVNTVILTVKDAAGNVSDPCSFTVTVIDNQPPVITSNGNKAVNNDAGQCGALVVVAASASDNCGTGPVTGVRSDGLLLTDAYPVGTTTITWNVTDIHGNGATALQTITVTDNEAPVVITQNVTILLNAAGTASITTTQINNNSTDNCGIATVSLDKNTFNCANVGANTVTLTVTDIHGNSATQTAVVTVVDQIAPTVLTNNMTIQLDANGTASITAAQINNNSTDNCGIATISLDKTAFDCSHVGQNTVTLTVTDVNGNSASQTATVTVQDNTAPIVTVPAAQVFCANASGSTQYTIPVAAATDNCSIATVTYAVTGATSRTGTGYDASGAFNIGTSTITWTVTDVNGNSSTGSITVVVNPLPVATYVSSNADAFCNQTSLTASSSINPALYSWSASNTPGSFSANPVLSLGLTNADGNYYLYTQSSVTGCVSATAAVYNFQKQTLSSSYTILAYKEVELGKYNQVQSGSVGVMTAKGEAEFKSYSGVTGAGSFVKAPKIDKDGSGITLNSQLIGIAAVTLPTMQYNTATTNSLPSLTVAQNNGGLSGNYKNLTVKKGISVTVSGTTFGNIRLEEGASIRFTSTVLNIENFTADRGAKNNDYTYVHFAPNTSVRVGNKVNIGSQVLVNPESYKVSFYMGDQRKDEEKFTVKGGDTRVIANILMPNGKLRVTATDSDNDDHDDCDHKAHSSKDCKHKGHEHNDCDHKGHSGANCQDDVYMTGLFIAEQVESKGNKVIWNSYDCSAPAAPITSVNNSKGVTQSVSEEKAIIKSEEELKVTVMPNPSTTYFTLKLESKYETPVNLRVVDGAGRVVDARSKLGSNSTFQIGHGYSSGTYYAELIQGTKRKVVQLIKARG